MFLRRSSTRGSALDFSSESFMEHFKPVGPLPGLRFMNSESIHGPQACAVFKSSLGNWGYREPLN